MSFSFADVVGALAQDRNVAWVLSLNETDARMTEYVVTLTSRNFILEDVVQRTGDPGDHVPPRRRCVSEVAEKATASLSIVSARLPLVVTAGLYGGRHYAEIASSGMENGAASVGRDTLTIDTQIRYDSAPLGAR
jgi:hypothetical protein